MNMTEVRDERIYGEMGGFCKKIREARARGRRRKVGKGGRMGIQYMRTVKKNVRDR